jgi:outer membrane protein assembly factor BamB
MLRRIDEVSLWRPALALLCMAWTLAGTRPVNGAAATKPADVAPKLKDPYRDVLRNYRPPFMGWMDGGGWNRSAKEMRLSTEPGFFTLCVINEDSRANALVKAGIEREKKGLHREALKVYQQIIDSFPSTMFRVSRYGVFVPVAQYCQRRILNFPPNDLEHYRTLHDARAGETFHSARRKHSLIGLSELVDSMLATTYGGRSILELGNAALDTGHYLAALERYETIADFFPPPEFRSRELELKVAYCRRMLGETPGKTNAADLPTELQPAQLGQLEKIAQTAEPEKKPFHSQLSSAPHVDADDYTLYPPTTDPMARKEPVWSASHHGSSPPFYVWTVPTVTDDSVLYRHKNIVYCHSILNGELRWTNDLGGRAGWQHRLDYNHEDVLVRDGLAFTAMRKGGPSLVALDETTGQLRWAYGPMVAATEEEAKMRFETAPAAGPNAVFAGYIMDNIEGDTHIDTEYGIMAFESTTGRVRWRRPLCRQSPGKFASGFAVRYRNRIRSFASPPTYHQGTVYYCTNAGAIVALDALSGRVKWLFRYPYWHNHPNSIHDATRGFGSVPSSRSGYASRLPAPVQWYNQRPLVLGEIVYFTPVDSPFLLSVNRRDGRVVWTHHKATHSLAYFMGPNRKGELVIVQSGRKDPSVPAVLLMDPKTGKRLNFKYDARRRRHYATSMIDIIREETHPVLVNLSPPSINFQIRHGMRPISQLGMNVAHFTVGARPLMTSDNQLYVTSFVHLGYPYYGSRQHIAHVDLDERKVVEQTDYYDGVALGYAFRSIHEPNSREYRRDNLAALKKLRQKSKAVKAQIQWLEMVCADDIPPNNHKPFRSFSRITFERFGVPFELRFGVGKMEMVYDRRAVEAALKKQKGPEADFARAELALADSRLGDASDLLRKCLRTISSEDLDFRSTIKQLLYRVHRQLARTAIRAERPDLELANALGMHRTASTLGDELETLFALADAYERQKKHDAASRCLRSVIQTYGHHEYAVAPILVGDASRERKTAQAILDRASAYAGSPLHGAEMRESIALVRKGLPLYFSAVSPLERLLTVRAGELASRRLDDLRQKASGFAAAFEKRAQAALSNQPAEVQLYRLPQFPGTKAAQAVLNALFEQAKKPESPAARQRRWHLADAARVARLDVPEEVRPLVLAPPPVTTSVPIQLPQKPIEVDLSDAEGINWLVLERRGRSDHRPELLFVGGRVRKRLDNKFILVCFDLSKQTDKPKWRIENLRLKGAGQEPGFFHAFVHKDLVVVNGLYDVLAFEHQTGTLRWRYRVPFDFEIRHAQLSGDLLLLSGMSETLALYVHSASKAGEVVWQESELGDLYSDPYFVGDRYVSVRKNPYNVTVRYRSTGRLMGRLELPNLSEHTGHPLLEDGPAELPIAHDGLRLAVTDGWYYVMVDIERMAIVWKRLIDNNDASRAASMRFTLRGDGFVVVKENYDQKAVYMLDSKTGRIRWTTNPKEGNVPRPMYSMFLDGGRLYGIGVYPGQGYYFVCHDCKTGQAVYRTEVTGYDSVPNVELVPQNYNGRMVVRLQDRQDFQINVFDLKTGKRVHVMNEKATGRFGQHGSVSTTVQNGRLVFLSKDKLNL